ncbi:MAG: thioredoxin domain-containing protein [Thermotogota bacterium]|nr:thioredoxin domain-containing protein [Thermotogota bacterium]
MKRTWVILMLVVASFASVVNANSFATIAKNVLIESFTATWCGPCKTYDPIVNEMYDADPSLILVHYHVQNDGLDFNWTNNRINWYGNQGIPMFVLDGVTKKIGGSPTFYMQFQKLISDRKNAIVSDPVEISLTYEEGLVEYAFQLEKPLENAQIVVLLVEDQVPDGRSVLRNVVRFAQTTPVRTLEDGKKEILQIPLNPSWKKDKLFAVVFVQKISSREVFGAAQSHRP